MHEWRRPERDTHSPLPASASDASGTRRLERWSARTHGTGVEVLVTVGDIAYRTSERESRGKAAGLWRAEAGGDREKGQAVLEPQRQCTLGRMTSGRKRQGSWVQSRVQISRRRAPEPRAQSEAPDSPQPQAGGCAKGAQRPTAELPTAPASARCVNPSVLTAPADMQMIAVGHPAGNRRSRREQSA